MPPVDFQNIRQGAWEMERNLKKFESDMFSFEKKGMAIPSGLKEKLTRMKTEMTDLKSVRTSEQLQDKGINTEEINATLQELENARRENEQKVRCTEDVRRGSRDMEREVKDFERRLKRLTAKKIAIPSEILDTLKKIKDNLAKMKTVKLCDDIHDIMGEMPDLMQSLNQSREQLEMLARWPQMSQNMNRELKRMTSELKRAKNIVSRLSKRGIDISDVYNAFETAVNNLKVAKAEAEEKVAAGDLEGAMESLQSDFYGQMEDVWQNQRVITMMQGLGQFQSEFKRTVAELQRKANALKRKKVVVSELTELLNQLKEKGAEITAMFKEKPIDPDGIVAAIDEMHGIRAEFDDALAALTGQTTAMPWQTGTAQFKAVQMSATVQQWMPSTAPATTATGPAVFGPSPGEMAGESNPSPAP